MKKTTFTVSDGKLVLDLQPADEGGYVVTSPLDPELITEAESLADAFDNARDAAAAMRALFAFFEIALSGEELDALITGPTFTQHSKHGTAFDFAARKAEYDMAAVAHQDELTKVAAWARVIAQTAGVPMELSNRLI